jgi:hypothetical protein
MICPHQRFHKEIDIARSRSAAQLWVKLNGQGDESKKMMIANDV